MRLYLVLVAFAAVALAAAGGSSASHLRYSSIGAQSTGAYSYDLTFAMGSAGCATVGSTFSALALLYGDGQSSSPSATVTSSACAGTYLWRYGTTTIAKTYDPSLNGQSVTLYSSGSARVSGLQNATLSFEMRSETSFVVGSGDSPPMTSVPPVVYCTSNTVCEFTIPASDIDGDTLRWRMSADAEMGGMANPTGMTIDSSTGRVTWDTNGRADGIWATNVTIEELDGVVIKGKTSADFIVAVGNYELPTWQAGTAADGTGFVLDFGEAFTLVLGADAPAGKNVTISSLGLPAWLTCPFPAAAASGVVTCTGTAPSVASSSTIVYTATASDGPAVTRAYSITARLPVVAPTREPAAPAVEPVPPPVVSALAPAATPVPGSAPTTRGVVASRDVILTVDVGTERFVLVSMSADMRDAVRVPVGSDGTVRYSLPGTGQGKTTVYVQHESGGEPASTSVVVDTIKPRLLRAILTPRVVRSTRSLASVSVKVGRNRYFIRLEGLDEETGIQSLQLSPKSGVEWRWRGILTDFSARVTGKTVRVRVADGAGNTSDWLVVPLKKAG